MTGFLDTNVRIYAFALDRRQVAARALLDDTNRIGVQSLKEFALAARRRLAMTWPQVVAALATIRDYAPPPLPLTIETHETGVRLARRYSLRVYDAMIVAAALAAGCDILWSEDMHDGLVVDQRLTIRHPFA